MIQVILKALGKNKYLEIKTYFSVCFSFKTAIFISEIACSAQGLDINLHYRLA